MGDDGGMRNSQPADRLLPARRCAEHAERGQDAHRQEKGGQQHPAQRSPPPAHPSFSAPIPPAVSSPLPAQQSLNGRDARFSPRSGERCCREPWRLRVAPTAIHYATRSRRTREYPSSARGRGRSARVVRGSKDPKSPSCRSGPRTGRSTRRGPQRQDHRCVLLRRAGDGIPLPGVARRHFPHAQC